MLGEVATIGWNLRRQYKVAPSAASTSECAARVYSVDTHPTGRSWPVSFCCSNTPPYPSLEEHTSSTKGFAAARKEQSRMLR